MALSLRQKAMQDHSENERAEHDRYGRKEQADRSPI
jgi:hypothetical protein